MPLPKRVIEPMYVARAVFDRQQLPSDLETVTNTTLTNIVRQLSSLSKHSEDLFGELARETNNLAERANSLQARIDKLSIKVTSLDSNVEEVSLQSLTENIQYVLQDIHMKKAFKSTTVFDQQIFSRATMPTAMLETYEMCDKPPPLDKLNCFRDDGRDGLKFYTDPNYFFELWRQEMQKDIERTMHDRKKFHKPKTENHSGAKRHNKRPRQPTNTREKQKQIAIGHGETIMPSNVTYITPTALQMHNEDPAYGMSIYDPNRPNRPNSIELRRSYPADAVDNYQPMSPHYQQQQQQNHYMQQQQQQQQYQPMYDEGMYNHYQSQMMQQNMSMESPYAPGTPSKGKPRPSEPPPAPPSTGSASNPNTPTRGRSMSTGRDTLPPPPPIPDVQSPQHQIQNGGMVAQQKIYGRVPGQMQNMTDSASIQMMQHQINNMNALNMQINQMNINDLPPPPPIPQTSPKQTSSPPNSAPPPPPPPPPLEGPLSPPPKMPNGDITTNGMLGGQQTQPQQPKLITPPKKVITPYQDDCRSELMKSIRDGVMLKKVERQKNDNKEYAPNAALHDVASILARRVAIELSDSECSESDEDENDWAETNETSA